MFASIIRTLLQSETGGKNRTEIYPHCNENSNYVFPENELRGLSPNFHIHVSVGDLYTVFPGLVHTFSGSRIDRPIVGVYKSLTETWRWQFYFMLQKIIKKSHLWYLTSCHKCVGLVLLNKKEEEELGLRPHNSFSVNICFEFSVLCLCVRLTLYALSPEPILAPDEWFIRKCFRILILANWG